MTIFRLHIPTEEELAARRLDTSWHEIHVFGRGWGWRRDSDEAYVMLEDLAQLGIEGDWNWPEFPEEKKLEILAKIQARKEAARKWRAEHPLPKLADLKDITPPLIQNIPPRLIASEIVGTQPMQGPPEIVEM